MNFAINKVSIIGYGNVGKFLASILDSLGMLHTVISKKEKIQSDITKAKFINNINQLKDLPDAFIIAVSDNLIETVAKELANNLKSKLEEIYVFHLSGTLSRNILDMCYKYKANTASIHPFQTFFCSNSSTNLLENATQTLTDTVWNIECLEKHISVIFNFIQKIKGIPIHMSQETINNKAIYHSTAVAASNYITMAISLSYKLANIAGIDPNIFLPKIINTTINNNLTALKNNKLALTGPIVRGDIEILEKHINSLKNNKSLKNIYCYLGLGLLELIKQEKVINNDNLEKIKELLNNEVKS